MIFLHSKKGEVKRIQSKVTTGLCVSSLQCWWKVHNMLLTLLFLLLWVRWSTILMEIKYMFFSLCLRQVNTNTQSGGSQQDKKYICSFFGERGRSIFCLDVTKIILKDKYTVCVYWWAKCWQRPRPLLQTHRLTFFTNAHPFVYKKEGVCECVCWGWFGGDKVSRATGSQSAL